MKLGLSTWCFLNSDIYSAVRTIGDAKFDFIELWGEIPHAYHEWVDKGRLKDVLSTYDSEVTLHAPFTDLNPAVPYQSLKAAVTKALCDFVKFSESLNASRVTIHPGSVHNEALIPTSVANSVSSLREVARVCGSRIQFNIENQVKSQSPYRFPLGSNLESIDLLLAEVEGAHLTMDTGHAYVSGIDPSSLYRRFRNSVTEVHLSDNSGSTDDHLAVGQGSANLNGLLAELRGTDVAVCLELDPHRLSPDEVMRSAMALKA